MPDSPDPLRIPPGVRAIQAELAARRWDSLEEAQAFVARKMAQYNTTPQAELGGFSPQELHELLSGDWSTIGPLAVNETVTLDGLSGSPLLSAARALLAAAAGPRGVKATATGKLSRKTVAMLLDTAAWPAGTVEETRTYNKVINEEDFWPVHILRVVLGLGKLLRRRSGAFHTTPRGRELLTEERAGALAAHLFRTFFRELNLAYLAPWGVESEDTGQQLVPLFLLRLVMLDDAWRPVHELVPLLDPSADVDDEIRRMRGWYPENLRDEEPRERLLPFAFGGFHSRILRPLEWFGLLEGRDRPSAVSIAPYRELRKTPLSDALLTIPPSLLSAARRRV